MARTRITITIDKTLLKKFKIRCKKEGFKISNKIEKLVEEDLRSWFKL